MLGPELSMPSLPTGGDRACGSALPMAVSTSFIPAISRCSPRRARLATPDRGDEPRRFSERLKGADLRSRTSAHAREVLAALGAVDLVVMFGEDTPIRLITTDQAERPGEGR